MSKEAKPRSVPGVRMPGSICLTVLLFLLALPLGSIPVSAQSMFLDVNGDGVYDSKDFWSIMSAESSTVDVYLVTNGGLYGDPSPCATAGLTSYVVNLYCPQSAAVFRDVENMVPGMTETFSPVATAFGLSVGYSGPYRLPPGKYHLFRVKMVQDHILGCGALDIVPTSCFAPEGVVTSFGTGFFGTGCVSNQGDDILRYGEDWNDAGNLIGCTDFPGRVPVVTCPAAVTGRELQPLSFPVSVFDPDCAIFSYWVEHVPAGALAPGLGPIAAGEARSTFSWTPAAGQAGTYTVKFWAEDPPYGLPPFWKYWDEESTVVTILPEQVVHEARVFTTSANRVTRLPHGAPFTCFQLEPTGDSFTLEDIVVSSLRIHYVSPICGDHDIAVGTTKTTKVKDTDGNGINELEACFGQGDLTTLSPCLGQGTTVLPLEITGTLENGDLIHGTVSQSFFRNGRALAAISPNPVNAASVVEFTTNSSGFARVEIFDVQGKRIAGSFEARSLDAGYHRVLLSSASVGGSRLASGVYFVRVATEHDGVETHAVMVVR